MNNYITSYDTPEGQAQAPGLQVYNPSTHSYEYLTKVKIPAAAVKLNNAKPKEENMVTEVVKDAKDFIRAHKSTIYVLAFLLIVDHFVFQGAMKGRLKNIMQTLVGKIETKLNETKM